MERKCPTQRDPGAQVSAAKFRANEWYVRPIGFDEARAFIEQHHYARGASNTGVYLFGLFHIWFNTLWGLTWWLPPTRVAAESVDPIRWRQVLALSRMAVFPGVMKNACSFMLSRSEQAIRRDGRFVALVTYADESQGHTGGVYRAANWEYVGRTGPYARWVDPATGRQVATQATKTRTVATMRALGYERTGSYFKHKFIRRLA